MQSYEGLWKFCCLYPHHEAAGLKGARNAGAQRESRMRQRNASAIIGRGVFLFKISVVLDRGCRLAAVTPYLDENSSRTARPGLPAVVSYCRPESLAPNLNGLY